MQGTVIRTATFDDMEVLRAFEQGVIAAERPYDKTLKDDTVYYDLVAMIEAEHIEVLVAEFQDQLIGCGYARIEKAKPYLKHDHYAYLAYMYVIPEHRRRGVNKLIIDGLKEWSRNQGMSELRLNVYIDNQHAIDAYEKSGFKKHVLEMRMELD
jgi:GNAT superfamily N-acetyltransferase